MCPQQRMLSGLEWQHAMKAQARRTTPHHDIAMTKRDTHSCIAALHAAELENCRQSERDGHNRLGKIALVLVLMQ